MAGPPKSALAFQRAVAVYRQGQLGEAEALCRKTLKADASHVAALHMLGVIQLRTAKPAGAVAALGRLLELQPDSPDVLNNRAMALHDLYRFDEALADLDRALALRPGYREALNNRAGLLFALRRFGEAAQSYAELLEIAPEPKLLGCLLRTRMSACDWTDFGKLSTEIVERVARGEPADEPMTFTWHSRSAALQRQLTEDYARRRYGQRALPAAARQPEGRIRLAYFSSDFRDHPMPYMYANLFERHDRSRFEVMAISYGPDDKSAMRARMEKAFDRFLDIRTLDDLEAARRIRREQVDILVDMSGYTAGNRTSILAFRPAPLQVNMQGFGLGAPFVDYVFSDAQTAPDGLREAMYREHVVRLPDTWVAADTAQQIAEATPSRAEEGLPAEGFVFCCFNTHYKITPAVFDAWMHLLSKVEGSVLWLRHDNDDTRTNLTRAAAQRGVASDRLIFARRVDLADHLARHRLAGLFLDTFPFGAQTTASHALWANLPVLTLRGETFASRTSASILHAAGLPELVVDTLDAYEALALGLAHDPERLAALRQKLAHQRTSAPLFDSERYRSAVEQAYLHMVERRRKGQPPVSFDVAAPS